jgi:hypothetical protein
LCRSSRTTGRARPCRPQKIRCMIRRTGRLVPSSFPLVFEHAREPARKTRAVDEAGLVGKEPHLELRRRGSLGEERLSGVGRPEEGDMRVILDARERAGSSGGERRRERAKVGRDAPEATWSRARARSLTRWSGGSSRSASTVQRGSARRTHPGTVPLGRRTRPSTSDFFLPTKTVPFSTRHE